MFTANRKQQPMNSPPPAYGSVASPYSRETTLLNGDWGHSRPRGTSGITKVVIALFLAIVVGQNFGYLSLLVDDISPGEKAAIRHLWHVEKATHTEEAKRWEHDRADHRQELIRWQAEREGEEHQRQVQRESWARERQEEEDKRQEQRNAFEQEREGWTRERQEEDRHRKEVLRRAQGVHWSEPWGNERCYAYGTRAYNAHLLDVPGDVNWLEVCNDMPITFHGQPVDHPNLCQRDRHSTWATWFVDFDEPQCVTYWDPLRDMGCSPGQTGMRRLEARLMNLHHGDDWDTMCRTTPATIRGVRYDHPTACEDKNGRTGIWDVPDDQCRQ